MVSILGWERAARRRSVTRGGLRSRPLRRAPLFDGGRVQAAHSSLGPVQAMPCDGELGGQLLAGRGVPGHGAFTAHSDLDAADGVAGYRLGFGGEFPAPMALELGGLG